MKKFILFVGLLILIVSGGVLFVRSVKISKVVCKSQFGPCENELDSKLQSAKGKTIFDAKTLLNEVLKKDTKILRFSVGFQLPAGFNVSVIEKKAIVAFVPRGGGDFILVSGDGEILAHDKNSLLPKVTSYLELDHERLVYVANLVSSLYIFYNVNSAIVDSDGIKISGINGMDVIFPLDGDRDVILGSLSLILSRLPSVKEDTKIKVIDLRFKNPVLR